MSFRSGLKFSSIHEPGSFFLSLCSLFLGVVFACVVQIWFQNLDEDGKMVRVNDIPLRDEPVLIKHGDKITFENCVVLSYEADPAAIIPPHPHDHALVTHTSPTIRPGHTVQVSSYPISTTASSLKQYPPYSRGVIIIIIILLILINQQHKMHEIHKQESTINGHQYTGTYYVMAGEQLANENEKLTSSPFSVFPT